MTFNLLFDNNLIYYGTFISCGLILGCVYCYLVRSKYTVIPSKNIEALTNGEIEAIVNENTVTITNNENIEAINDDDTESDVDSYYDCITSHFETLDEVDITDLDLFFMPYVDFDVCSIQELKFFEISSIYSKEIAEYYITDEQLMDIICYFTDTELATNDINDFILLIMSYLNI